MVKEAIERINAGLTLAPGQGGAQIQVDDLKLILAAAEAYAAVPEQPGASNLDAAFKYHITAEEETRLKEIKSYVHGLLAGPVAGDLETELIKIYRALNKIIALRD